MTSGNDPIPLPTKLTSKLLPESSPAPAAATGEPSSPATAPTTAAAAKPAASTKPVVADVRPTSAAPVQNVADISGGEPAGETVPPAATPQSLVQPLTTATTATTEATGAGTSGWTPVKQLIAGELVAVIFLAVLAMVLLSRHGRSSVSRNSGTVVLGDGSHVGEPPAPSDDGYADGFADARHGEPPVDLPGT